MKNTPCDLVPVSALVSALEPVAHDLCKLVGFDSEAVACPHNVEAGLPQLKHWQVFYQRMLMALLPELPLGLRAQMFCAGMEALARTVPPVAPAVTH